MAADSDGIDYVSDRPLAPVVGPNHQLMAEIRPQPDVESAVIDTSGATRPSGCEASRCDLGQRHIVVVAMDVRIRLHRHIRMVWSVSDERPVVVITGGDDRVAASIIVPVVVVNQVFAAISFEIRR